MFVSHSMKNILRSWKKTGLFAVLMISLVMILTIGLSLSVAIQDFLAQCDESYTTIAVFDYIGPDYPDETKYDPNLAKTAEAMNELFRAGSDCVELWDSNETALGYIHGSTFKNQSAPSKDNAVLVVYLRTVKETEGVYGGIVEEALYSFNDSRGKMVYVNTMGIELELDRYYLLHGAFYKGQSSYAYFMVTPCSAVWAEKAGIPNKLEDMIVDVTTENGGYSISEKGYFQKLADSYAVINNSVTVHASLKVDDLLPFQQGMLYLTEGESFTQNEYDDGKPGCIISEALAENLGVKPGDEIALSLTAAEGCTLMDSYWVETGFQYEHKFKVTGLFNSNKDWMYHIFIPKTDKIDMSANHFSYTLGQATIDNRKAEQFLADIRPQLPGRVRLTIYDQGYAGISKPLQDILRTATIITWICLVAGIAVNILFGFLYVYRQREVANIMLRLGTGRKNIFTYFLFGSGAVAGFACAVGSALSGMVSGYFVNLVNKVVSEYSAGDVRFSNSNFSMKKVIEFVPEITPEVYVFVVLFVFIFAVLSCFVFTVASIAPPRKKRRFFGWTGQTKTRSLRGGPVKYALLSMWRGNMRSLIPIGAALAAVILLCQLTSRLEQYQDKLQDVKSNTQIRGYFTDVSGQRISGLTLDADTINEVFNSGYASEICVTDSYGFQYLGRSVINGIENEISPVKLPSSAFGWETLYSKLSQGPQLIFSNSLEHAPEFVYSKSVATEYLEGYDQSILSAETGEVPCCLVTTDFMAENGVQLGDTIRVMLLYMDRSMTPRAQNIDLLVVGSYVKEGSKDNIYCQLDYYVPLKALLGNDPANKLMLQRLTFESASFTLKNTSALPDFKEYLYEAGYSEVNRVSMIRSFIIIEDSVYLSTESSLSQRLWYMERVFPVLYGLIELLALFISFILILLRKKEIAVMRGMGASKAVSFLSLFNEQLMLCLIGSLTGLVLCVFILKIYSGLSHLLCAIFGLCWIAGAAISAARINHCTVMSILRDEE